MSFDVRPHRPLIPSATQANREADRWTFLYDYRKLMDQSGFEWEVHLKHRQVPAPSDPQKIIWTIELHITASPTCSQLVKTGTLDPKSDGRLIHILGEEIIPISFRPFLFNGSEEPEVLRKVQIFCPKLRVLMETKDWHPFKRKQVEKRVVSLTSFGFDDLNLAF